MISPSSSSQPSLPLLLLPPLSPILPSFSPLMQYGNLYNGMAHYDTTGEEIVSQCEGDYTYSVLICLHGKS